MAQSQSGAVAARPLPGVRSDRRFARSAPAIRHLKQRPRLAAFALLASMARRTKDRSGRRAGGNGHWGRRVKLLRKSNNQNYAKSQEAPIFFRAFEHSRTDGFAK